MKGQLNNIPPFWKDDLSTYVPEHIMPIAPHAIPHDNYQGTMLKQSFNEQLPQCWPQFYKELDVEEGSICWLTMEPGEIIPIHKDHFYMLKTRKNVPVESCIRYLIMLEDWKPGHIVQLDDWTLSNWKAGDVWYLDHTVDHWAANCGRENFYTCQVSTIK